MKYYTIGQIFRLGLLKNFKGEPYKQKATISRIVANLPHKIQQTPYGPAKVVSLKDIDAYNKKRVIR